MKSNLILLQENLKNQPFLLKKLASFNDLNDIPFFDIKHFLVLSELKKSKLNSVKIDLNAYSSFNSLYNTYKKLFPDQPSSIYFYNLDFEEKILFLKYEKIEFELLDNRLIINPKNYAEVKLVDINTGVYVKILLIGKVILTIVKNHFI